VYKKENVKEEGKIFKGHARTVHREECETKILWSMERGEKERCYGVRKGRMGEIEKKDYVQLRGGGVRG
jgi:hypothetical protein